MRKELIEKVIFPKPGKYIVAVSGGVDSISLLDILSNHDDYELIIAHFNHGIRPDSDLDMELVHNLASKYGLEFVAESANLGKDASEALAREYRYRFLRDIKSEYGALAILTAHHLDDRIETMELNKQRGSGWRGLAPLRATDEIKRPLLNIFKSELVKYAKDNNLNWREDSTNKTLDTPRNHIRDKLAKDLQLKERLHQELINNDHIRDQKELELKSIIDNVVGIDLNKITINRSKFVSLDVETARDALFYLLQNINNLDINRGLVVSLEHFIKTAKVGKQKPLSKDISAKSQAKDVAINLS
ncbi:MAG: tRNA lysidine(34) synthetase TilS [Candidatus Saccharimonadales bacterium]